MPTPITATQLRDELDRLAMSVLNELLEAQPGLFRQVLREQLVRRGWAPAPFRSGRLSAVSDGALVCLLAMAVERAEELYITVDDDLLIPPDAEALEQLRRAVDGA